jgi:MYXO-CTERM domain-containing protein
VSAPRTAALALALATLAPSAARAQGDYFAIRVVDRDGAPVPCVKLRTVHELRFRTDASGRVAFFEPGLMDGDVFFHVSGPHVEHEEDFLGYRGRAVAVREGGAATIRVTRTGAPPCEAGDLHTRRLERGVPGPEGWFRLDVVDAETGRGVPLVELAMDGRRWVSDSAGVVAVDPIGLEGRTLEATVRSHGYAFADEGRLELTPRAGGHVTVEARREMPAERLYRVTGGGIYRDSVLLGREPPLSQPTLAGRVVGQDTVFTAVHRGRLFWIWGDTNRPGYPLGNFHASGATSALPTDGGLDPEVGVDLRYFVDETGFSRPMAPPETVPGEGVTWLSGLVSVPDASGEARLFAIFGKFASLTERTRFGMLAFDEAQQRFVAGVDFDEGPDARYPRENAFLVRHGEAAWVYYHGPGIRIPARAEAMLDPSTYEAFTPFTDRGGEAVARDADGRALYRWRAGGIPHPTLASELDPEDRLVGHVVDMATGAPIEVHENGSTERNDFTGRYLRLMMSRADLGEIWLALADTPMGPWVHARRIVHHDRYTFYNPRHHRVFDRDFGRRIHFEATYTASFSGNPERTPRYDYNQVMYGLDLDRPELAVPVPIYESARGELGDARVVRPGDAPLAARFFAPVAAGVGTEPVWWSGPACEPRRLIVGGEPRTPPLFHALPADAPVGPHRTELWEIWGEPGETPRYSVVREGNARRLAVVWRNPTRVRLPVGAHRRAPFPDAGPDRCLAEGEPLALEPGTWTIDGRASEGGTVTLEPGLHVLTRVAARDDGLRAEDHALVRVGAPPPLPPPPTGGCGCRAAGPPAGRAPWLALAAGLLALRRRGSTRR